MGDLLLESKLSSAQQEYAHHVVSNAKTMLHIGESRFVRV